MDENELFRQMLFKLIDLKKELDACKEELERIRKGEEKDAEATEREDETQQHR